ncbi:MAG: AAA domain-containing protein [Desulfobacterales bacterium]|nr:AAA domain-containing protein [Desulfobacterales bacterium]MCP4163400.1 AAA domain-containing protein [Deltaproteobacteria bacterium]
MVKEFDYYGIDGDTFFSIIDNMYDEVIVYDANYNIVFLNQACKRHYSTSPEAMIGKSFFDFVDIDWWSPSILPVVYKEKKAMAIRQKTYTQTELLTIAVPLFDEHNNIKYVVMNVRDEINEADLYNPQYIVQETILDEKQKPVSKSKEMKKVMKLVKKVSKIDATCIITGESGTGKSMIAKHMHRLGLRSDQSFINVNCASIPNELFESEFFGYVKGAFTGAKSTGKKGLLELADNGILLLDEISELSLSAQAKLLTVLQDKEYMPVGASKTVKIDVKIIAATNKNLKNMVDIGTFREDLYYRINVIEIYIPPLRKRREDILQLVHSFMNQFNNKYGLTRQLSSSVLQVLLEHEWKGNVRELRHLIERLVVTVDSLVIDVNHLPKNVFGIIDQTREEENLSFDEKLIKYEAYIVQSAYKKYNSSRKLAVHLSISQTRANNLIKKHIKGTSNN